MSCFWIKLKCHVFYQTYYQVRTINITLPFYKLCSKVLKAVFLLYPVCWIIISITDIIILSTDCGIMSELEESSFLFPTTGYCILIQFVEHRTSLQIALTCVLCVALPFVLPAITSVICFFIQAFILLKSSSTRNKVNYRITVTILYLTLVFFICNTLYFVGGLVTVICYPEQIIKPHGTVLYCLHFLGVILTLINSAANPIILITRGEELKKFIRESEGYVRARRTLKRLSNTIGKGTKPTPKTASVTVEKNL